MLELTTRGYECDQTATVPIDRLLAFCEHQRWESMRDPEVGIVEEVHKGFFFVVLEQRIERLVSVGMAVPLRMEMTLDEVGRSTIWVRHVLRRQSDGVPVAIARVRGGWMSPRRRLARIPDALREIAKRQAALAREELTGEEGVGGTPGSWFDPPTLSRLARGLLTPAEEPLGPVVARRMVQPRDADIFAHVNAATWLRYFEDAAGTATPAWRASLVYKKEARPGQEVCLHIAREGEVLQCAATLDGTMLVAAAIELQAPSSEAG